MIQIRSSRRFLAVGLIVSLQSLFMPSWAAQPAASLSGTILSAGDRAPVAGAVLHLGDARSGKIFSSPPAGADGSFRIRNLPPAVYEVAVQARDGLFPVATTMVVPPGETAGVHVAMNAKRTNHPKTGASGSKRQRRPVWDNPLTAGLVVLGSAFLIGFAIDDFTDDDPEPQASPSNI